MIVKQHLSSVFVRKKVLLLILCGLCLVFSVDCVDGVILKRPFVKFKSGVKHSLISTIIAAEGSGDSEPDQSQLERINDNPHPFHMRILLGEDHVTPGPTPEFYGKTDGFGCTV